MLAAAFPDTDTELVSNMVLGFCNDGSS